MSYDVGDLWTPELTVKDDNGVLTDATVTVATTSPTGVAGAPTVVHVSTGVYTAQVLLDEAGAWLAVWTVSGAVTGVETQNAYVRRLGSNIISIDEVRAKALNKTLTADDDEIARMIDAAIAEYEEWVGPVSGSGSVEFPGGGVEAVLPRGATSVTSAVYGDGTVIDIADLRVTSSGLLRWNDSTAGRFSRGYVTVGYTVGAVPANHREAIIADVAGYFDLTQSGPAGPDDGYGLANRGAPQTLFPRIRALASPSIA